MIADYPANDGVPELNYLQDFSSAPFRYHLP